MSRWLVKAGIQRAIGALPRNNFWNTQLQIHVTRSMRLTPPRLEGRLRRCHRHLAAYATHSPLGGEPPAVALEVGTGWYPVVPLGLFLCGVEGVSTYDIVPLLDAGRVRETMRRLLEAGDDGRLAELLPSYQPEQLQRLRSASAGDAGSARDLLRAVNVEYVVGDASRTGRATDSVDLVLSNVALEYIPYGTLETMLRELRRVVAARGVMSHEIDLADQYAAFDNSITKFNFLRFSDRMWRLIKNPLIPLNRLRISDYRELLARARFEIIEEDLTCGTAAELSSVSLAPRFRAYSEQDLLVTRAWIVARRTSHGGES